LDADEYYVVRIPYSERETAEFWRKETTLDVPQYYSQASVGFYDRHYDWSVQVQRCTANCDRVRDDGARKEGLEVSRASPTWTFYWRPDLGVPTPGGSATRPPTPTP
jgi:hypothetical protein